MQRVDYDPEIDPSIRLEREVAARESELSSRIRLEIERYVEEHDLVPRGTEAAEGPFAEGDLSVPPWEEPGAPEKGGVERVELRTEPGQGSPVPPRDERDERRERRREEREARDVEREARRRERERRAEGRRRAVQSVVSGSILSSEWMRRMWPYMLGIAFVLVGYIAYDFQVQQLHLRRQRLEREVRELSVRAVERTAERVRQTSRSAIVERLKNKGIGLEEFPHPVKRIER
jgi:hypothetical protein